MISDAVIVMSFAERTLLNTFSMFEIVLILLICIRKQLHDYEKWAYSCRMLNEAFGLPGWKSLNEKSSQADQVLRNWNLSEKNEIRAYLRQVLRLDSENFAGFCERVKNWCSAVCAAFRCGLAARDISYACRPGKVKFWVRRCESAYFASSFISWSVVIGSGCIIPVVTELK